MPELERDYSQARAYTFETIKQPRRCIISLRREVFDITEFLFDHPGGKNILDKCNGEEIDYILDDGNHRDILDAELQNPKIKWIGILLDGIALAKNKSLELELARRKEQVASASMPFLRSPHVFFLSRGNPGYQEKKQVLKFFAF